MVHVSQRCPNILIKKSPKMITDDVKKSTEVTRPHVLETIPAQ